MDVQEHKYICYQLDELEKTIEKLEDGVERNKLIEKAYQLIESLKKIEEPSKSDVMAMSMFKYLDSNVRLLGQYDAKPKAQHYRDRFDRFKRPTKNIL